MKLRCPPKREECGDLGGDGREGTAGKWFGKSPLLFWPDFPPFWGCALHAGAESSVKPRAFSKKTDICFFY